MFDVGQSWFDAFTSVANHYGLSFGSVYQVYLYKIRLDLGKNWKSKRATSDFSYMFMSNGMKPMKCCDKKIPPTKFVLERTKFLKIKSSSLSMVKPVGINVEKLESLGYSRAREVQACIDDLEEKVNEPIGKVKASVKKQKNIMKSRCRSIRDDLISRFNPESCINLNCLDNYPYLSKEIKAKAENGMVLPEVAKQSYTSRLLQGTHVVEKKSGGPFVFNKEVIFEKYLNQESYWTGKKIHEEFRNSVSTEKRELKKRIETITAERETLFSGPKKRRYRDAAQSARNEDLKSQQLELKNRYSALLKAEEIEDKENLIKEDKLGELILEDKVLDIASMFANKERNYIKKKNFKDFLINNKILEKDKIYKGYKMEPALALDRMSSCVDTSVGETCKEDKVKMGYFKELVKKVERLSSNGHLRGEEKDKLTPYFEKYKVEKSETKKNKKKKIKSKRLTERKNLQGISKETKKLIDTVKMESNRNWFKKDKDFKSSFKTGSYLSRSLLYHIIRKTVEISTSAIGGAEFTVEGEAERIKEGLIKKIMDEKRFRILDEREIVF